MPIVLVLKGRSQDWLPYLPAQAFDCVVTSPSYWSQRDHGHPDQDGLEPTPRQYVENQLAVFANVKRALKLTGNVWVVIDDTYSSGRGQPKGPDGKQAARRFGIRPADRNPKITGVPKKSLSLVPEMFAIGMVYELGYVLRARLVWDKPNALPEPTAFDRVQRTAETIFHFTHQIRHYYFKKQPLIERNLDRSVWQIPVKPFNGSHRAIFPEELVTPILLSSCPTGGWVLDHNAGSGTVGSVAYREGMNSVMIELTEAYVDSVMIPRLRKNGIPERDIEIYELRQAPAVVERLSRLGCVPGYSPSSRE